MRRLVRLFAVIAVVGLTASDAYAARRSRDDIDEVDDDSGSSSDSGGGNSIIKDRSKHRRPHMISPMLNVPWFYGFGIGAGMRYTLPIVHDGFLPKVNDSFELEFGLDYVWRRWGYLIGFNDYHSIIIPVEARWTFYFFPNFAAYAKAGLGVEVNISGTTAFVGPNVYHNLLAPGLLWEFSEGMHLRAELGYWGFKAGVGFEL